MTAVDAQRVADGARRKARIAARVDHVIAEQMGGLAGGAGRGRPQKRRWCRWCGNDLPVGRYVPWCSEGCRLWLKQDAALRALKGEAAQ